MTDLVKRLLAEKMRLLFQNVSTVLLVIIGHLVASAFLYFLIRDVVDETSLQAWYLVLVLLVATLFAIFYWYREEIDYPSLLWLNKAYYFVMFLIGACWGYMGGWLFPVDSVLHQVIMLLVLSAVIGGAVGLQSAFIPSVILMAAPALLPITIRLFMMGDPLHIILGLMNVSYAGIMATILFQINSSTTKVIILNEDLKEEVEERKRVEASLAEAILEQDVIIAAMPDIFYLFDMNANLVKWNKKMEELAGFSTNEMKGKNISAFVPEAEIDDILEAFAEVFKKGVHWIDGHMVDKDGRLIPYHFSGVAIKNSSGEFIGLAGVGRDMTERNKVEEKLKVLAITDSLTNIFNRRHFQEMGKMELERSERYKRKLSLLMFDIDFFKKINDTYGHATGDEVIIKVVNTCLEKLREIDIFARIGGEEFAIILPETGKKGAVEVAERLREAVSGAGVMTDEKTLFVTISIGLVSLNSSDHDLDSIMRQADVALYKAKQSGRNRVVTYKPKAV